MKRIISICSIVCLLGTALAGPLLTTPPPNGHVNLVWGYDTNMLSTNLIFYVYGTTNFSVPVEQWPVVTNVVGTNLSVAMDITPGKNYFVMTASNFWGESGISSSVASTPSVPRTMNDSVKIEKAP